MPQIAIGAAVAGGLSAATGATIGTLTVAQTAFVVAGISAATSFAMQQLAQSGGGPDLPDFKTELRDRTQLARVTASEQRVVFGETQVSGPLNLFEGAGDSNEYLYLAVPQAAHPSEEFVSATLNDEDVGPRAGDGVVTDGRFEDKVRLVPHDGAFDQAASATLVDEVDNWTADDKGGGVTYSELRLEWDRDVWPNGFNAYKSVWKGAHVYDPRDTGVDILSSNLGAAALFTTDVAHGLTAGQYVWIRDHDDAVRTDTTKPRVHKMYQVATTPASNTFTLIDEDGDTVALTTAGTTGTVTLMKWSDNWALCVHRYMTHPATINATNEEFDYTNIAAQANICDEQVALTADPETFTADDTTDVVTTDAAKAWRTGDVVRLTTTDTLPGGLATATDYYLIRTGKDTFKLASSLDDALAGSAVDITSAGTGTHTVSRQSQRRYTCNGVVKLGANPIGPLDDMMTAAAGVVVDDEGVFKIYAGAATSSTGTTNETDMRGGVLDVEPELPLAETFNVARGVYSDPDQFYAEVGLPKYENTTYIAADGERIYRDFKFLFTNDPIAGQRLLKIALERARQSITTAFPAKPRKFKTAVWDVEAVSIDHLGWSGKEFRVMSVTENPDYGLDLVYREESSTIWDWALGEETVLDPAPNTNLPSARTVQAPTSLVLDSGTDVLDVRQDGSIWSRLKLSWTAPADRFVTSGGYVEVQYKKSSAATWIEAPRVDGDITETYILDVQDGVDYDVRIRGRNTTGVASAWVTSTDHTVIGKTAPPSDVATFTAQQNGNVVTFRWSAITDLDRTGYELRYMAAPFSWDDATVLSKETKGTLVTNAGLPPGSWIIGIKAIDTTGNYSTNETTYAITVVNFNDIVATFAGESGRWPGPRSGFVKHDVSGKLVPDSGTLAADMTDARLWDQMVYDPVSVATYEALNVIDLGFDADGVRVWGDLAATLGSGESGAADPILEIDVRDQAGSYDGYDEWTVGSVDARFIKCRAKIDTATGVAALSRFSVTCDVEERTETGEDVDVDPGGTLVSFAERFHLKPNVQATPDDAGSPVQGLFAVKSAVTVSGFTVHVFDSAGNDVGGTVDWTAVGA